MYMFNFKTNTNNSRMRKFDSFGIWLRFLTVGSVVPMNFALITKLARLFFVACIIVTWNVMVELVDSDIAIFHDMSWLPTIVARQLRPLWREIGVGLSLKSVTFVFVSSRRAFLILPWFLLLFTGVVRRRRARGRRAGVSPPVNLPASRCLFKKVIQLRDGEIICLRKQLFCVSQSCCWITVFVDNLKFFITLSRFP